MLDDKNPIGRTFKHHGNIIILPKIVPIFGEYGGTPKKIRAECWLICRHGSLASPGDLRGTRAKGVETGWEFNVLQLDHSTAGCG